MPPHAGRWTILALLALISATHQFHRHSLPAVGSQIMADYSISPTSMGALYSFSFLLTYVVMMTPGGWLADRVGTRRTLLLVAGESALFAALTGLLGWLALGPLAAWWWIAAVRGSMGICSAPLYPSTSRTVGNWFGRAEQPLANALVTAAAALGIAAAFKGMSWLSERPGVGWRGAFVIAGAATGPVLALWAFLGRSRPEPQAPGEAVPHSGAGTMSLARLFDHRGILALTLSYLALGYLQYIFFYWIKFYFQDILKLGESGSANYTFITDISMMVFTPLGGLLSGPLIRRWGLRRGLRIVPMAGMTLAAIFLLVGTVSTTIPWIVVSFSLALGFLGMSEGPFWTAAVRLGGRFGATTAGFMNTGGNLGGLLSPFLTPSIAEWVNRSSWGQAAGDPALGWTAALMVGSFICLAGALFWLRVDLDRPLDAGLD